MYQLLFSPQAKKDSKKVASSAFSTKGHPDGSRDRISNYYFMHSSKGTDYSLPINNTDGDETRPRNVAVMYCIKY